MHKIRLWDVPTRLFHWLLVLGVALLWLTAEQGELVAKVLPGIETTRLHSWLGYGVLGLLVFRLIWGVVGSDTARFAQFVKGPKAIRAYVRASKAGEPTHVIGHNPAGALMVVALLVLLLTQAVTGLGAYDDIDFQGPLVNALGEEVSHLFNKIHHLNFNLIIAAVAVHVAAIVFYKKVKRDDLVTPMIRGSKEVDASIAQPRMRPIWLALLVALIAAAVVWGGIEWAGAIGVVQTSG
ncbi:cytochrome b/b6 domain-containing protein [Burkholderiaceae bacterium DAT-1]|nr:cytochrome b/b6 domain-containing protein [Burkholderiaceae bacterium DAT-1]